MQSFGTLIPARVASRYSPHREAQLNRNTLQGFTTRTAEKRKVSLSSAKPAGITFTLLLAAVLRGGVRLLSSQFPGLPSRQPRTKDTKSVQSLGQASSPRPFIAKAVIPSFNYSVRLPDRGLQDG